ncbi:MAG TPA: DUF2314 domain-containing protein, partial [Labilithrix sp.]|nr:DUF2314 domain-containing protein [Labilithrix sp.]
LPGDRGPAAETPAEDRAAAAAAESGSKPGLERPPRAAAELAVITDKPDDVVRRIATAGEIGRRLDVRHCGGACDALKKLMSDEDAFEIEVRKTEDLLLPPKDTLDTVAAGLTPNERASLHDRKTAVTIRTQGNITPEQLPARTAFAVSSVLAEALDGYVYDEVSRRIETAEEATAHVITAPLGAPVFARKHIVVQLYRQDDGTARLLSLGMMRFGSPDLSIRGANMAAGPMLAEVLNAAARQIAHGKSESPVTVTLEDIAQVVGKKAAELSTNPAAARPAVLDVVTPERIEGDPDNEMGELVPPGGATRESWDAVVAGLFGVPPSMNAPSDDKELGDVAKKARRELPTVIKRFEAGEGDLFVKGPFPIPPDSRVDGGAATELLWIAAASCTTQVCTGVLSNEPTYATNIALGKTTSVRLDEATDWMIQHRDGGTVGGESIKVLKARASK